MGSQGEAARAVSRARELAKARAKGRQAAMARADAEETERIRCQQAELKAAFYARNPDLGSAAA